MWTVIFEKFSNFRVELLLEFVLKKSYETETYIFANLESVNIFQNFENSSNFMITFFRPIFSLLSEEFIHINMLSMGNWQDQCFFWVTTSIKLGIFNQCAFPSSKSHRRSLNIEILVISPRSSDNVNIDYLVVLYTRKKCYS